MSEPGVSSEIFRFLEARLSSPCSSPVQHEAVHTLDEFVSVAMGTGCRTSTTCCCIARGASTTLYNLVNELHSRDLDGLLNRQDGGAHGVATQLAHPPS